MTEKPTVLVLGAGINGAALARELAIAGVGVAVVDADDIAAGATAWSTRLIHGGLRYLEYGEIGLVRESLVERDRLLRQAPHLVRRLPFYVPVRGRWGGLWAAAARLVGLERLARRLRGASGRGGWTLGIGLTLYDLLSAGADWPRHRIVRAGTAGLPQVDAASYPLGATYADGQSLAPERLAVEMLVDAARIAGERGTAFSLLTRHHVRPGAGGGLRIEPVGGHAGAVHDIWPHAIVNATGGWVDRTYAELFPDAATRRLIGGTKGSHLVVRSPRLREAVGDYGVYAEADDGRPVFVLPFGPQLVLVGTTDLPYDGDPAEAVADEGEIAYLLAAVGRLFPGPGVSRAEVQQHYSGVRPLPATPDAAAPGAITRRHLLVRHAGTRLPTWSVVGGKLTTCRSLAETAAKTVLAAIGVPVAGNSRERLLPGAWQAEGGRGRAVASALAAASAAGVPAEDRDQAVDRLVDLFGTRAAEVWAGDAGPRLIRDVGLPAAAVAFCVRHEWAQTLADIVERRLMLVFDPALSARALTDIAEALVAAGMLPAAERTAAVEAYRGRLWRRFGRTLEDRAT